MGRALPLDDDEEAENDRIIGRHPSVRSVAQYLVGVNRNLPPHLLRIAREFRSLTLWLLDAIDDGPELTAGLRKLLEAKDCAVRAALVEKGA